MPLDINQFSVVELAPTGSSGNWYRVERRTRRRGATLVSGYSLPPAGLMAGRFDVTTCVVGYFADSPLTTLYETLFRRETAHRTLANVAERQVLRATLRAPLRLLDLCGAEEASPVLVSTRYAETQALALAAHAQGVDGIRYASPQHPSHQCIAVFESALAKLGIVEKTPLVDNTGLRVHRWVAQAQRGSLVPLI